MQINYLSISEVLLFMPILHGYGLGVFMKTGCASEIKAFGLPWQSQQSQPRS